MAWVKDPISNLPNVLLTSYLRNTCSWSIIGHTQYRLFCLKLDAQKGKLLHNLVMKDVVWKVINTKISTSARVQTIYSVASGIKSGYRATFSNCVNGLLVCNGSADQEKFRQDLFNIAMTTLSSKIVQQGREMFANLAVDAVLRLKVKTLACNTSQGVISRLTVTC